MPACPGCPRRATKARNAPITRAADAAGPSRPAPRDRRLGAVRLGGAAVLHADHHLRLRAVSSPRPIAPDPVEGQALWGFATAARRASWSRCSRRCSARSPTRPGGASRGSRRSARCSSSDRRCCGSAGRAMPSVIPLVLCAYAIGAIGVEFATVFNNAMMPIAGAAGAARPAVRHRLGGRLCRRAGQPHHRARLPRRQSADRQDAARHHAAVRARSGAARRRPRGRAAHGDLVRRVRPAAVSVHAGPCRARLPLRDGGAARARELADTLRRLPRAPQCRGLSARQHDLRRRHWWRCSRSAASMRPARSAGARSRSACSASCSTITATHRRLCSAASSTTGSARSR